MTLPRSHAYLGRPPYAAHAAPPDPRHKTEGRPAASRPAAPPLTGDAGRGPDAGWGLDAGRGPDSGRGPDAGGARIRRLHSDRVWEQRRALGRRLASLRSRSGFSQWEFAPLTGYSRSTLSDAELGRHRLRREFWERCDGALMTDGVLTAAYDRIEVAATAVRRSARSQAQAAREEQAARRLQALLPVPGAAGLGAGGAAGPAPVMAPAAAGPAPEPDGITWGSAGSAGAATGGVPAVTAPSQAVPGGPVPGGPVRAARSGRRGPGRRGPGRRSPGRRGPGRAGQPGGDGPARGRRCAVRGDQGGAVPALPSAGHRHARCRRAACRRRPGRVAHGAHRRKAPPPAAASRPR